MQKHRDTFISKGLLYPAVLGDQGHVKLTTYALKPGGDDILHRLHGINDRDTLKYFRESLVTDLQKEIDNCKPRILLLSNEHCSSRLTSINEIENIKTLLLTFSSQIRIVIYLRRQDECLVSSYSTAIKSGHSYRISHPSAEEMELRYNYQNIISRWAGVFGRANIIVRIFSKGGDFNLVEDFLRVVHDPNYLIADHQNMYVNRSLDVKSIELLRRINFYLPLYESGHLTPFRDNIGELLERISGSHPPYRADPELLSNFMSKFHKSNLSVAEDYIGHVFEHGDPLFGDNLSRSEPTADGKDITVDEVIEMVSRVWKEKVAETVHLRKMLADCIEKCAKEK
ncbi:hypothetical protein MBRA_05726 [Methylobacterium brachiatum]|nr:hypothetical protein MBRA_05726 [Methylobacterium brachiatum]